MTNTKTKYEPFVINAKSGMLNRGKILGKPVDDFWVGNFNPTDKPMNKQECPMLYVDTQNMVIGAFRGEDRGPTSETPFGEPEVLTVEDPGPEHKRPAYRSASYAVWVKKNNNGTPYLYVAQNSNNYVERVRARDAGLATG